MATTKRKPAKKAKKTTQTSVASPMKSEFLTLFVIVAGLLFAVFMYFPSGIVGKWIRMLFTGLFGLPAYVLPVIFLVFSIHRAIGKQFEENKKKYVQSALTVLSLSSLFQLFSGNPAVNPFLGPSLSGYWVGGINGLGGGVLGGILCDIFANTVGGIAAGIILITILIVLIMVLTKWSPLKALLRLIVRCFMDVKAARREIEEEVAEEIAVEKKQTPKKKPMPNFGDEEVTRERSDHLVIPKPYDDEDYIPDSIKDVIIDGDNLDEAPYDFKDLDAILDEALPTGPEKPQEPSPFSVKAEDIESEETEPEKPGTPLEKVQSLTVEETEEIAQELEEAFERIPYTFPDMDLLNRGSDSSDSADSRTELKETATKLIATLKSFNVDAKLLNVSKGPTVTRYELKPGEGVKVSKIVGLSDDIALRLAATGVRIEAPIPNKEAIGIEIPNKTVATVSIREVLDSEEFRSFPSKLAFALGKDIAGKNVVVDLGKMPHVLIAGATGSGKSVCINTLITSIIYKADPNEVKLLMIDPKVVELSIYNGIPHLMIPVVTDPRRASGALYWAVQEMTRRYAMFAESNVRDLKGYNEMILESGGENTLPQVVIIIDELADLMMVAPGEVEDSICRLAQMARAAGMHLVIATQRPSVDVITGIIKANIPSRIAFAVSSQIDSRTILDAGGADKLLGRGDMLFAPVGAPKPTRLQGAFISDKEVERVVEFIKSGSTVRYDEDVLEKIENGKVVNISGNNGDHDAGDNDELLPRAIEIAVDTGKISASYLQRRLKIGFSRAARIVDQMEERGWIGPQDGSKPREVLLSKEDYLEMSIQ
ncbi:MAG: DNA translocase FtsK, partial [Ruminococcaceae bacterium]|nr:DNA translocase FtsK [Oscillospiraceae bacterium]